MKYVLLLAVIGMAGGALGQVVEGPHKMFRNAFQQATVLPIQMDRNGHAILLDVVLMRKALDCPDYMWIVVDGRLKGYYCTLRPPWPAEDIQLPIPEALRRKP